MHPRRLGLLLASAVSAGLLAGCTPSPAGAGAPNPQKSAAGSSNSPSGGGTSLAAAVKQLTVSTESRAGYEREKFHLWIDADHDGCDTRKEVLKVEATRKPRQGEDCQLTGGVWTSYYDGKTIREARRLDTDHMVPLAEAWDSGASKWSPAKRERFANDLDGERSLVAVTLSINRAKGDQDPAEWMPPKRSAQCMYAADWVTTKLRWNLTADAPERSKLKDLADACPDTTLDIEPAS